MIKAGAVWLALAVLCAGAAAQEPLTLEQAEAIAVKNHPRLAAARLAAQAAGESVKQANAALMPVVAVNATASVADHGTAVTSGFVTTSSLFSRTSAGLAVTQTVYDFGRSRSLAGSAQSRARSFDESANAVRAEILLRVREAYYRTLLAAAQRRVVEETVQTRKVLLKHISALAQSNLRSTLDVSFAELAVAEAELMLDRADNEQRAAMLQLSSAMGYSDDRQFALAEPPEPDPLADTADSMVTEAIRLRPELESQRLELQAARLAADNERRQALPLVSATGVGGALGWHDEKLRPHYAGIGMNLNIPLFNGYLFRSRFREASLKADVLAQSLRDGEIRVARDVRGAWIDARNAFQRLALTARVSEQAGKTLRLAQARYDLGLSSIAELTQAQLSRTAADVGAAAARFEYRIRRSVLDYQAGALR